MDLSRPKIMGILNLTPDSFYDGGQNNDPLRAVKKLNFFCLRAQTFLTSELIHRVREQIISPKSQRTRD